MRKADSNCRLGELLISLNWFPEVDDVCNNKIL